MPKLTEKIEKLKAKRLTNLYIYNKLNQSKVARKEGVTRQAINQRLKNNPAIPETLQEVFKNIGIDTEYKAKKFKELLEATRLQSIAFKIVEVPDNKTRMSALNLACQVDGDIKDVPLIDQSVHHHLTHIYLPEQTENGLETATPTRDIP